MPVITARKIFGIAEIDFADAIGGAGANDVDVSQEFLVCGHAAAALFARHAVAEAGDDRKLEVFAARAVEDDAVGVDEAEFGAVAEERDRRALGDFDADAIRAECAGR